MFVHTKQCIFGSHQSVLTCKVHLLFPLPEINVSCDICVCDCCVVPDEVQWLVLVPHTPPGPTFVQQVALVLRSMSADGILAPVTPLENTQ